MGIVLKQSFQNTIITFIGFTFGAVNTLFLYTNILQPEYYGLVTFILATGAILMPLFAFGAHNTLVKFYSAQEEGSKNAFLTLVIVSPLLVLIPAVGITWAFYDDIAAFLSQKNAIVTDYVWYFFLVGLAMAYFEVFFAWSKVHLKSVFGNFMKEVFARLCITVLLILLYFDSISLAFFFKALVAVYLLRTILMKLYAFSLRRPKLNFSFPKESKVILQYGMLMVLGGSVALILMEIDKFMINQFISIENVAYYGVAVYIATVISVPNRAMNQITYPMTAEYLNQGNLFELENLYKKTSLTSLIASGLLFILIIVNIDDLYLMIPEAYRDGFTIVFIIGMVKVFDSFLGNINAVLYYSKYYKTVLLFGICFALTTILLNLWLIPLLGIEGAALASFIAIFLFNSIKMIFVKLKFGMLPYSNSTLKVFGLLLLLGFLFSYLTLSLHPLLSIALKSIFVLLIYLGVLHRFQISEDVSILIAKLLRRTK
ncbi:lipopolysaccharide biosynthesis protein [Croceitalea rosinachiae]|uniref:Oligosaccharide flippase family protein n=1 Tax=Croceitalea rosinachiae TaxID=3075596 RepID=A0ABU3AB41_9FLAO|nr:oligosaccharide flippase family protein [Croceitalea sp. F388]MDT0607403.1 oligosaccharide flippase family protein [Croceitalea sp. F388]